MQRVLKLGGDNYTYKDLKRDLLLFEDGDKASKTLQREKYKTLAIQIDDPNEENFSKKSPLKNLSITTEQFMQELVNEDKDKLEGK